MSLPSPPRVFRISFYTFLLNDFSPLSWSLEQATADTSDPTGNNKGSFFARKLTSFSVCWKMIGHFCGLIKQQERNVVRVWVAVCGEERCVTTLKTAARETNAVLDDFFFGGGVVCLFVCLFCFVLFCFFAFMFFFLIPISRKPMLRYETYTRRHCSVR